MFRPRYRHPPFTAPLNWTDYRWDAGPWRHGGFSARRVFRGRRGSHPFLLLLVAGVAAVVAARLLSGLQSRNGSWARRGLYAIALLTIVNMFSRNRGGQRW